MSGSSRGVQQAGGSSRQAAGWTGGRTRKRRRAAAAGEAAAAAMQTWRMGKAAEGRMSMAADQQMRHYEMCLATMTMTCSTCQLARRGATCHSTAQHVPSPVLGVTVRHSPSHKRSKRGMCV